MARNLRAAAAVTALAVLTVAACSASQATGGTRAASCRVGVWAEDFTDAGHLAWRVSLGAPADLHESPPAQLAAVRTPAGTVAVFTDGDVLYGLRPGDGHQVWHRAVGTVTDLEAWHGTVLALAYADGKAPRLVSLDAATGTVRWTVSLGSGVLEIDTFAVTSDGVAVVEADSTGDIKTRGKTLAGIDLATGKRLWTRSYPSVPLVRVSGTDVVILTTTSSYSPATLTGLQGRTAKRLWSRTGFPHTVSVLSAPGGRVLVDDANAAPPPPTRKVTVYPVLALSAATGATLWKVQTPAPAAEAWEARVTGVWATPAGVLIGTGLAAKAYVTDPVARLYLADLRTGKVRWSASGNVDSSATPLITAANVITVVTTGSTGTVADYSARDGTVRWKAPISDEYGRYFARPAGPDVLVAFPMSSNEPSRLLALDVATGATRATDRLPFTSMAVAPLSVTGHDALLASETASCAPAVHPKPVKTATAP